MLETLYCQNNQIWFIGSEFDDETGTVALAPDAVCDIAGNPSIRVEEGDDGGMRIGLEELDPQDEV